MDILWNIVLIIVCLAVMCFCILYLYVFLRALKEQRKMKKTKANGLAQQPKLDPKTELLLGAMGAKILHHQIEEHRKERERKEYESLYWQEAIRDKNNIH